MELQQYIQTELSKHTEPGEVHFDIGLRIEGKTILVDDRSTNRIQFTVKVEKK